MEIAPPHLDVARHTLPAVVYPFRTPSRQWGRGVAIATRSHATESLP